MLKAILSFFGLVVLFVITVFVACDNDGYWISQENNDSKYKEGFKVIVYDSCEYIMRENSYQGFLAHKGNCRFCEERIKQEK
jgi:hypothetical protein